MDTLNQDNISFQNMLKFYFLESNKDPCNDSLHYLYASYIKEMSDKELQLRQFVAQVTSQPENNGAAGTQGGKVLAVVDTAKGKVDTATTKAPQVAMQPNKLVVVNDYKRLNSAVVFLSRNYSTVAKMKTLPVNGDAIKKP
jgi:hypothetical protein